MEELLSKKIDDAVGVDACFIIIFSLAWSTQSGSVSMVHFIVRLQLKYEYLILTAVVRLNWQFLTVANPALYRWTIPLFWLGLRSRITLCLEVTSFHILLGFHRICRESAWWKTDDPTERTMVDKLFVVIPDSGFCPGLLEEVDSRIKFAGKQWRIWTSRLHWEVCPLSVVDLWLV